MGHILGALAEFERSLTVKGTRRQLVDLKFYFFKVWRLSLSSQSGTPLTVTLVLYHGIPHYGHSILIQQRTQDSRS